MTVPISEVASFACTIPAGTTIANPHPVPLPMLTMDIEWIEWEVPPGPRGDVGFWLGSHGQPTIPFASGPPSWIVTDGRAAHWDVHHLAGADQDWQLVGYNLGVNPHTVYVRFGLTLPAASGGDTGLLNIAVLNS